jgi:hypothetical protein
MPLWLRGVWEKIISRSVEESWAAVLFRSCNQLGASLDEPGFSHAMPGILAHDPESSSALDDILRRGQDDRVYTFMR